MNKEISKEQAIALLDAYHNNIVTVEFIKKDGTTRKMTGRQGVAKYLVNKDQTLRGSRRSKPDPSRFTILWEFAKHAYRMFDVERLLTVRVGGQVYIVRG